ncbi:aspartate--ammonia ligase [Clostridium sp. D2Q-11]|uniref:Aspartate--ammonia ligase n=1 Tax=Anaeromonas frigoriresistens TaxID=2683708 RepID=A0A942V1I4_9FIRM|nr:aspartate--ammonia ligase [Anaeromonas frigoriresistens]MBS4540166.1 aspartate--ammonia ligase [Anaeromonas frigoriresistens]
MEAIEKKLIIPKTYKAKLDLLETEVAIKEVKDYFERSLSKKLDLTRVSAPLFVISDTGLNDNLNGVERPVSFDVLGVGGKDVEIVHSLAKWKRMALSRYNFKIGEGLYTDMNAIRRDEDLDNIHSIYVDQWDWEKIINKEDRKIESLKSIVKKIYYVFKDTERYINNKYAKLKSFLPNEIYFISSQELEDRYPNFTPKEREHAIAKEKGAVFIMQIGNMLNSGIKHDGRAPDYDDWELNGDIIFWYPVLNIALEVSSMGIRVSEESLKRQLKVAGCEHRKSLRYHRELLEGKLPYTIGGGIGQSRICMFFLQKAHIGEVQAAIWPEDMIKECEKQKIMIL